MATNCMGAPRVSVVIPLYNKEGYIARTLDSVSSQSFGDFEVLVVDDGSTDGGAAVVEGCAGRDPRFRLIRKANGGVSSARNRGICESRGNLICFLDADDEWDSAHLANIVGLADEFPHAAMMFDQCVVKRGDDLKPDPWFQLAGHLGSGLLSSYPQAMTVSPNLINSSNACIRRDSIPSVAFDEGDAIGEDLDLWLRMALSHEVAYCSAVGAFYHRDTVQNARTSNAVHCPKGYFATIASALDDSNVAAADKRALYHVRDRKMTAYVFSLINSGDRVKAREELGGWESKSAYGRLKPILWTASCLPGFCVSAASALRARVS